MNAPSTDSAAGRPSLIRGPWHRSSRLVARFVLVFLLFCNLPGQHVFWVAENVADRRDHGRLTEDVLQHGWPLTYVTRSFWQPVKEGIEANLFLLWSQVYDFQMVALAVNLLVAVAVSLLAGIAFEAWRRERSHLWQLHMRDLMAVLFVVAMTGAWFANRRHEYEKNRKFCRCCSR